jgi:hypothetical protein
MVEIPRDEGVEKKVRVAAKRDVPHTGRYLMMARLAALEEQGQRAMMEFQESHG